MWKGSFAGALLGGFILQVGGQLAPAAAAGLPASTIISDGVLVGDTQGPALPPDASIFSVNGDGTGLTTLANIGNAMPSWTPDGHIIYVSYSGTAPQIWLMNADGSNAHQVGDLGGIAPVMPQMARNGLIAFLGVETGTTPALMTMKSDGTGLTTVPLSTGMDPGEFSLALSGTWIAFSNQTQGPYNRELWRVDVNGTGLEQLTFPTTDANYPDANAPSISPDETQIAFFNGKAADPGAAGATQSIFTWGERNIAVMPATGGAITHLTSCTPVTTQAEYDALAATDCITADNPSWTPDGGWLVYDRLSTQTQQTWLVGADGLNAQTLYSSSRGVARVPLALTPLVVSGGTLDLGGATQTEDGGVIMTGGTIQNGTLSTDISFVLQDGTIAAVLAGAGAVIKTTDGTVTLTGANTYTGGTYVQAGTLKLSGAGTLGAASGTLSVSGGTLDLGATTQTQNGGVWLTGGTIQNGTLASSGTFAMQAGTVDAVLAGAGAVNKTTDGTVTLNNANTYSGGTTISGGRLTVGNDNALGSADVTMAVGTTLGFSGDHTVSNNFALTGQPTFVVDADNTATLTGVISDGSPGSDAGIVGKSGAGTLILSGANTFSGGTAVSGGRLTVGNDSALGTGDVAMAAGTTLAFSGDRTISNNFALTGDPTFFVDTGNTATVSGVISDGSSGAGDVAKAGAGALTLSGANSYSGGTTVNAGTLALSGAGTLGATANALAVSGATLDLGGTTQIQDGGVTLSGIIQNGTLSSTGTFTLKAGLVSAVLAGSGAVNKTTADTVTLTGANAYSGGTTIAAGTLQLGNGGSTGSIAGDIADNGILAFNRSNTYTFGKVISGTGAVQQTGTGTTILTGANSYSGGTTVSAGTLALSGAGTLGATANTLVVSGAALDLGGTTQTQNGGVTLSGIIQNGTLTSIHSFALKAGLVSAVLAGKGWVNKTTVDTVTLTADNTYTGGTTIGDGTLQLGIGGTTGSVSGNVIDNGIFAINRANTYTFANVISGTGALHQVGGGTTILTGLNSYSGGTTISNGTLQIGNGGASGSIVGDVADNGTLTFDRSDTVSFAGIISGTGTLQQNGAGTLTLTGANTYTGATTVNDGTLLVNGSIDSSSGLWVNSGATVGGTGILPSTIIANGGTLAPGNAIGAIAVNGNLTFKHGSTFAVQVSPSAADRANISGSALLAGTVDARFASDHYIARSYSILSATGGLGGTRFDSLSTGNLPINFNASLSYTANDVLLNLTAALGTGTNLNASQQPIANAVDGYFNNGGTLPTGFTALFRRTGSSLGNALAQLSGEAGAAPQVGSTQLTSSFLTLLLNGFTGDRGNNIGGFGPALGYANTPRPSSAATSAFAALDDAAGIPEKSDKRWSVWGSGYGGWSNASGDAASGNSSTKANAYGVASGLDYRLTTDATVGFALGGGGTNWNLANGLGGGKSDVFQVGLYGTWRFGAAYVSAAATYGWNRMTTDRTVMAYGVDKLTASFDANMIGGRVETGRRFDLPLPFGVTPYAALQTQALYLPDYTETASSGSDQFALAYSSRTATATRGELGAWFELSTSMGARAINLFSRAAWAHDWQSDAAVTASFQSLPGTRFIVNGAAPPHDLALATLGAEIELSPSVKVSAKFDGEFSAGFQSYAGTGTLSYSW